jgi:hypothetical protein
MDDIADFVGGWMRGSAEAARAAGYDMPEGALAETFRVVTTG